MHVHVIQEAPQMVVGILVAPILGQIHLLFLDRPDQAFGVAVLPGGAKSAMLIATP